MTKTPFSILIFTLFIFLVGADSATALCIKNEKANLRKGPGTKYEKLWQVFQYMPFKLLKTKGDWKLVEDLDGDTYWVYAPLTTQEYKCASIKNNETKKRGRTLPPRSFVHKKAGHQNPLSIGLPI